MAAAFGLTTQIYNNHLKSALLLTGFPVLLLLMIAAFFGALDVAMQAGLSATPRPTDWAQAVQAAEAGVVAYGHWALIAAGAWFLIAYFFHGRIMRAAAGSRPVTRQEYPKIYNMLENLCISRGLAMPAFEIIDTPALNAFASGIDEKSYKIVLTQGLVDTLRDDELEAVIGHELTHIMNRDVRLLVISVIFVGIISFLAHAVYKMLVYSRPSRGGKRGGALALVIALVVLGIGYLLATLIRFALSRRREYLADAGSVELTKNPEAMMRALQRIAGHDTVAGMPGDVQQMCIENSHSFMGIFATHPKIEDRIRVISEMTNTPVPAASAGPWGRA